MNNVRHVLGISGGKDSTALAIYLRQRYPQLSIEYYFCDTGKELQETYQLLDNLDIFLGKKIQRRKAAEGSPEDPFDHFLKLYGGYLPSSNARWCTKKLKLEPFEEFVGNEPVISYVAIREDESREAYISKKPNIQSIFPFRRNIWSEDVTFRVLDNRNTGRIVELYKKVLGKLSPELLATIKREVSPDFVAQRKLSALFSFGIQSYNQVVFEFLQDTDYPLSKVEHFPLLDKEETFNKEGVIKLLQESGIGVPRYYEKRQFEVNGEKGFYSRSRSGCYFCFFQQKIEWVWLLEKHPDLFAKAMQYEKEGYTWVQNERLENLMKPERVKQIKEDYLTTSSRNSNVRSNKLIDIIDDGDGEGCAACFI